MKEIIIELLMSRAKVLVLVSIIIDYGLKEVRICGEIMELVKHRVREIMGWRDSQMVS